MDKLKQYWMWPVAIITLISGLLMFGQKLDAWFNADEYFEETEDQFQNMYKAQQNYYNQQAMYQQQMNQSWEHQRTVDNQQNEWIRKWYGNE